MKKKWKKRRSDEEKKPVIKEFRVKKKKPKISFCFVRQPFFFL